MANHLKIVIGQLDFLVGDIAGNLQKMLHSCTVAQEKFNADLIIFPELALCGYPPEDLLFHRGIPSQIENSIEKLKIASQTLGIIVGFPEYIDENIFNTAALLYQGEDIARQRKQLLPNYGVFDEKRYFTPGEQSHTVTFKGCKLGMVICEDMWFDGPVMTQAQQDAELVISINASPFDFHKLNERQTLLQRHTTQNQVAMIYVQTVGGQDELVFDGGSMAVNAKGEITHTAKFFAETLMPITYHLGVRDFAEPHYIAKPISTDAHIYAALVAGVRDYVNKNHFNSAVIGLSGGIDSALTLAIAVDALGADHVHALILPSRYTADMSIEDAKELANNAGVKYDILSIEDTFNACLNTLAPVFAGDKPDTTEENIQARCRGILLMAYSNKKKAILLTTGNKSEMAVGYATLYGDMAGGFAVLKDVPKQLVYQLANYCNLEHNLIPRRIITRAPSAELAPNQTDQDSLPPYETLDDIIERYVEKDDSREHIIQDGFDSKIVDKVLTLIDRNEYKRRQAPPGVRITRRAFGRDRRYPITSGFSHKGDLNEKN